MQLTPFQRLIKRVKHFLFPMKDWKDRVRRYRKGQVVWTLPLYPKLAPMAPWPHEWAVLALIPKGDGDAEVAFCDTFSDVSGKEATGEDAVRCARCGINLHVSDTTMETNIDIPSCSWCVGLVANA